MTQTDLQGEHSQQLADSFRLAMRRLIATVTIITAGDSENRAGMVATAVMSVAADPPSLAVGVNRAASVWKMIGDTRRFTVNLLSTNHAPLVMPFSGQLQGEERFNVGSWENHHSLTPYLKDAVVSLFCRVDGELAYGTHTLFIGAVDQILIRPDNPEPLLWRNGSFANAVPLDELLR